MSTLVLGLGNPILTDDGVGVRVVEALRARLPEGAEIEAEELSVGGLTLMERMEGYRRVILVDALISGEVAPGTLRRLTLDDLRAISYTQHSASPHDASLVTALDFGRRSGLKLPDDIVIIGIEVENVVDFGDSPTPAVGAAIPHAVEAVMLELARWGAVPAPDGSSTSRQSGSSQEV